MSDTPRTDSVAEHYVPTHWPVALEGMEAFARELERENARLLAFIDNPHAIHAHYLASVYPG